MAKIFVAISVARVAFVDRFDLISKLWLKQTVPNGKLKLDMSFHFNFDLAHRKFFFKAVASNSFTLPYKVI